MHTILIGKKTLEKKLDHHFPNADAEISGIKLIGQSGYILAFNVTFSGPEFFVSGFPKEWRELYEENNYFFFDPIFVWAVTRTGTRRWSDIKLPDMRGVMKKAQDFGLVYGLTISRKVAGKRSFISVARADREINDDEIKFLEERFEQISRLVVDKCGLTEKELAVLRLLAEGYDHAAVSDMLCVSVPAVRNRINKARLKLDADSTMHAVTISLKRNYI